MSILIDVLHNSLLHVNLWLRHWFLLNCSYPTLVYWPCFVFSSAVITWLGAHCSWRNQRGQCPLYPEFVQSHDLDWCFESLVSHLFWLNLRECNFCIAPLDSIFWDCASWILSCVALPLIGNPTWHWRVQTPFTMNMSHDMIHHMDGMDQIVFLPTCPLSRLCLCGLRCLRVIFCFWLLTCLIARIGHESIEGCTLSGRALDQIKGYNIFLPWVSIKNSDLQAFAWCVLTNLDWDFRVNFLPWEV